MEMISLIDESVVEHPAGFVYIIAAIVITSNIDEIRESLRDQVIRDGRFRPSHWCEEGPRVRTLLCEICEAATAVGQTFVAPCGRKGQEAARTRLLTAAAEWTHHEGSSELTIESRGRSLNNRDRQTLRKYAESERKVLRVQWRSKNEPLLWLADSLAGATRENLMSPGSSPVINRLLTALHADAPWWG